MNYRLMNVDFSTWNSPVISCIVLNLQFLSMTSLILRIPFPMYIFLYFVWHVKFQEFIMPYILFFYFIACFYFFYFFIFKRDSPGQFHVDTCRPVKELWNEYEQQQVASEDLWGWVCRTFFLSLRFLQQCFGWAEVAVPEKKECLLKES